MSIKKTIVCLLIILIGFAGACKKHNGQKVSAQTEQNNSLLQEVSGKILFQSDRDGDWEIYVMNADGSDVVQLTYNSADDEYPVWSPDGKRIAFKSNRDGNFEIYVMNADGSNQQRLTEHPSNDEDPAWSPDGKRLAFHSDRESAMEIYLMNVDGSGLTQFTKTIGKNALPAWSPGGKRMAYTGNRYLGWNVYVTNLDKSDDKKITDGHGACRPDWSPDGTRIAFVSQEADGKGDVWSIQPDGSEKMQLTFDEERYDYYPAWSPDGNYLTYATTPDKETGNWEIYVMTANGKRHAQITRDPARDKFPDWQRGSVPEKLLERQQFVYEVEAAPRTTGRPVQDGEASGGRAVYAGKDDDAGYLMFGPYQRYQAGEYVAHFRLKTEEGHEDSPSIVVDVAANKGERILARKELTGQDVQGNQGYVDIQLPFSLETEQNLEFRIYRASGAKLWGDNVTVFRITP